MAMMASAKGVRVDVVHILSAGPLTAGLARKFYQAMRDYENGDILRIDDGNMFDVWVAGRCFGRGELTYMEYEDGYGFGIRFTEIAPKRPRIG